MYRVFVEDEDFIKAYTTRHLELRSGGNVLKDFSLDFIELKSVMVESERR